METTTRLITMLYSTLFPDFYHQLEINAV